MIEETTGMGGWGMGIKRWMWKWVTGWGRGVLAWALALWLGVALGGCGDGGATVIPKPLLGADQTVGERNVLAGEVAEVSPPPGIQQLKPFLDGYSPQVRIMAPRNGEVLNQTAVTVRVRLQGLPVYRDDRGRLGPHLRLFLDDLPPLILDDLPDGQGEIPLGDLTPGTHTLRVLAVRPWGEGFKNDGALAQVSFQVFTASGQGVTAGVPQLIYNSPQGKVGAQPILLDFWLRDIPLHEVAQGDEAIADWRLHCTINGQTFVFDRWQPIYLTGFKPGQNWIKLELIDETGAVFPNPFNTALRVVDYQPDGTDPLAGLFTGQGDWQSWRSLVDPTYVPPTPAMSEPEAESAPETVNAEPSPETPMILQDIPEEEVPNRVEEESPPGSTNLEAELVTEPESAIKNETTADRFSDPSEAAISPATESPELAVPPEEISPEQVDSTFPEEEAPTSTPIPPAPAEEMAIEQEDGADAAIVQEAIPNTPPTSLDVPALPSDLSPSDVAPTFGEQATEAVAP